MKFFVVIALLLLTSSSWALELEKFGTGYNAFYTARTACGSSKKLAHRFPYTSILKSPSRNVWALNFHATSSYDGVDVVVGGKCAILEFDDVFNSIQAECGQKLKINYRNVNRCRVSAIKVADDRVVLRVVLIPDDPALKAELRAEVGFQTDGGVVSLKLLKVLVVKSDAGVLS